MDMACTYVMFFSVCVCVCVCVCAKYKFVWLCLCRRVPTCVIQFCPCVFGKGQGRVGTEICGTIVHTLLHFLPQLPLLLSYSMNHKNLAEL